MFAALAYRNMDREVNKFLEASLEGAEVIADSLIDNEIVKSIPVVGTALKVISGSRDLRNKIFFAKIQRFIEEIESISASDRLQFKGKIVSDNNLMITVGESALLVLDKLSDLQKAEMLGFYFACLLSGLLDQYQFKRVAAAVDTAFIDDLDRFLSWSVDEGLSQESYMEALLSSGITVLSAGQTWDDTGQLFYEASSMGRHMAELWHAHKQS